MALLEDAPELDLYDRDWLIHTRSEERAPARVGSTSQVHRSLISHGCVINGTVVNSVLSPGVRVEVGAVVRDSIVMFDSVIRSGAVVDRAILDKEVVVGPGSIIGEGADLTIPNRQEPARLFTGITVVGKRAIIPRGVRIGRNVKIGGDVRTSDFATRVVRSGATVERRDDAAQRRRASTTLDGDVSPATGSGSTGTTGSLRSATVGPSAIRQSADAPSGGRRRPD